MTLQAADMTEDRGGALSLLEKLNVTALVRAVLARKRLLLQATVVGVGLGLVTAAMGTISGAPANAVVTASEASDFAALTVPEVFSFNNEQALERLTRELTRRENLGQAIARFQASRQSVPVAALLSAYMLDEERLDVLVRRVDSNERLEAGGRSIQIEIKGTHPRIGMRLLNELFVVAHERAIAETARDRRTAMENEERRLGFVLAATQPQKRNRELLGFELDALIKEALARRKNQLIQLKEALDVAEAIGQAKPSLPDFVMSDSGRSNAGGIDGRSVPLFLFGSEALREQIKLLEARASDDHEDPRILEIRRDLDLLDRAGAGRVLRLRGDRDPISEAYALAAQRLVVLKGLMAEPLGPYRLLDVIRNPSRGSYSDLANILTNVLRSVMLLWVLAVLWISGRFVLGVMGGTSDPKA